MGSPCLFTRQQALKMGYFYWLCVNNLNHLLTELSLGYLEDGKFYLESKASFIDIGSIASFKLFLIAWLREYCTFLDCSEVNFKSWPCSKYCIASFELFSLKKSCSNINFFFFFKYVLY